MELNAISLLSGDHVGLVSSAGSNVNREGVWGIVGEYFDGERWRHADSCFGFVGDDWKNSGYDTDIMRATVDASEDARVCRCCGRPIVKKTGVR